MFVICQYFRHPSAARAAEFEYCLRDHIGSGHELVLFEEHPAPEDIRRGARTCIASPQRLTYAGALRWANDNLPAGSVAAIINLDIMIRFTHEAMAAHFQQYPQHFLALSRMEFDPATQTAGYHAELEEQRYYNCQDAWVFRTPAPSFPLSDFPVGNCPGCDNAIAYRAAEAGLIPINLAGTFPIWHYDMARAKNPHTLMTRDATTSLERPEKFGRLFLPRISVGETLVVERFLEHAKTQIGAVVARQGYSPDTDARTTAYLASLIAARFLPGRWDLDYLLSCIALNVSTVMYNAPHMISANPEEVRKQGEAGR